MGLFGKKNEFISWEDTSTQKHKHKLEIDGYGELVTADDRRLILKIRKCKHCNSIQVLTMGEDLPLPEVPLLRFKTPDKGSTLTNAYIIASRDFR